MRFLVTAILLAGTAAVVVLAAQNPMRPGQWETVMQMEMPGMPMKMPEMKNAQCVTAEDLAKDPSTGLPRGMAGQRGNKDTCTVSDYKVDGSRVTWSMACTGQMAMNGTGEMTFKGDSYTGVMKMSMPQGEMTMNVAGKRLGDCTQQ